MVQFHAGPPNLTKNIMSEKTIGNNNLIVHNKREGSQYVCIIWGGIRRITETHTLICVCSTPELALARVNGYTLKDLDYYEDKALEFWFEEVEVDHLCGSLSMYKAREIMRNKRTGD